MFIPTNNTLIATVPIPFTGYTPTNAALLTSVPLAFDTNALYIGAMQPGGLWIGAVQPATTPTSTDTNFFFMF